jgi:hypothetical protein
MNDRRGNIVRIADRIRVASSCMPPRLDSLWDEPQEYQTAVTLA